LSLTRLRILFHFGAFCEQPDKMLLCFARLGLSRDLVGFATHLSFPVDWCHMFADFAAHHGEEQPSLVFDLAAALAPSLHPWFNLADAHGGDLPAVVSSDLTRQGIDEQCEWMCEVLCIGGRGDAVSGGVGGSSSAAVGAGDHWDSRRVLVAARAQAQRAESLVSAAKSGESADRSTRYARRFVRGEARRQAADGEIDFEATKKVVADPAFLPGRTAGRLSSSKTTSKASKRSLAAARDNADAWDARDVESFPPTPLRDTWRVIGNAAFRLTASRRDGRLRCMPLATASQRRQPGVPSAAWSAFRVHFARREFERVAYGSLLCHDDDVASGGGDNDVDAVVVRRRRRRRGTSQDGGYIGCDDDVVVAEERSGAETADGNGGDADNDVEYESDDYDDYAGSDYDDDDDDDGSDDEGGGGAGDAGAIQCRQQ
jgi:hypothetical protein